MKIIIFLGLIFFCISCTNSTKKVNKIDYNALLKNLDKREFFFEASDLGAFGSKTRLIIFSSFDECGEWGGHKETIEIFAKKNKNFYAKYIRNKVDCNNIRELYGKPEFQKLDFEKEFVLNEKQQKAISKYLKELVENKIIEKFPGHSGQSFGAKKTDSTLYINIYDNNPINLKNYNSLLQALNIDKVEINKE